MFTSVHQPMQLGRYSTVISVDGVCFVVWCGYNVHVCVSHPMQLGRYSTVLSLDVHSLMQCGFSGLVCASSHAPFIGKLLNGTFISLPLFCEEVLPFFKGVLNSTLMWCCLFCLLEKPRKEDQVIL